MQAGPDAVSRQRAPVHAGQPADRGPGAGHRVQVRLGQPAVLRAGRPRRPAGGIDAGPVPEGAHGGCAHRAEADGPVPRRHERPGGGAPAAARQAGERRGPPRPLASVLRHGHGRGPNDETIAVK
eukprot:3954599-Lingulodinium_polyedra.AAC.2